MGDTSYVMSTCVQSLFTRLSFMMQQGAAKRPGRLSEPFQLLMTPWLQLQGMYRPGPYVCSLPSEKVMPLGLSRGSGGVRGLVNLSCLRSAYSSRSFIASSRSSLDKATSQLSTQYITFASWKSSSDQDGSLLFCRSYKTEWIVETRDLAEQLSSCEWIWGLLCDFFRQ